MPGALDTCLCPSPTHCAVMSACSLGKYVAVSNVRARIGVKQGFLYGLRTASASGQSISAMLADLRGDIAVLEGEYTTLFTTMDALRTAVPVPRAPSRNHSAKRSSPVRPLPTGNFDRYLVISAIHCRISTKEGTMLGLEASTSSDASVVRGVTVT